MSLRHIVRDFVDRVRMNPARGVAPEELEALETEARDDWTGAHTALNSPMAPWTWEERVILQSGNAESQRVALEFPHAVEIVGLYPAVVPIALGGVLRVPTTDDVDVALDLDQTVYQTNAQGISVPGGTQGGNFVTLTSIGVLVPRLLGLRIMGVNPNVGIQFRWKLGPGVFEDSMITLAFFWRDAVPNHSYQVPNPGNYRRTR